MVFSSKRFLKMSIPVVGEECNRTARGKTKRQEGGMGWPRGGGSPRIHRGKWTYCLGVSSPENGKTARRKGKEKGVKIKKKLTRTRKRIEGDPAKTKKEPGGVTKPLRKKEEAKKKDIKRAQKKKKGLMRKERERGGGGGGRRKKKSPKGKKEKGNLWGGESELEGRNIKGPKVLPVLGERGGKKGVGLEKSERIGRIHQSCKNQGSVSLNGKKQQKD